MKFNDIIYENTFEFSPIPTIIWDEELNIVFVNTATINLLNTKEKSDIINGFDKFNPEIQLNLVSSKVSYKEKIKTAFKNGQDEFLWIHQTLDKKQVFCNVILKRVDEQNPKIFAFIENLNSELVGYSLDRRIEDYFTNVLSKNALMNSVFSTLQETAYYWDLRTGFATFYGAKGSINGIKGSQVVKFPEFFNENKLVFHEDEEIFNKMLNDVKQGYRNSYDLRLTHKKGSSPVYYRMEYDFIYDTHKKPIAIVGFASNIDGEKMLEMKAQTDLLTGCSNKITAEKMIADYIAHNNDKESVLYIIDIDNFKAINDNLGHHFGDVVLREIAGKLKTCFRQDDIVGRIGGDEFLVLAKNIKTDKIIEQKAKNILKAFENEYKSESGSYKVSGSIGVAKFPTNGKYFEDLYKAADKALYESKLKGKDCYTVYTDALIDGTMRSRTILENAGRLADSYFDSEIISDVFELLFEAQNLELSINMALKRIGKKYNADRCYIFESFDDGKMYDNTYEWCEDGISPEIDGLKNITAEMLGDFFKFADKEGIVYSNDLSVLVAEGAFELMDNQSIKSFLHAQIFENDKVKLFLGLDDCMAPRVWSPKEINSLKYLAKIISIFLSFKKNNK